MKPTAEWRHLSTSKSDVLHPLNMHPKIAVAVLALPRRAYSNHMLDSPFAADLLRGRPIFSTVKALLWTVHRFCFSSEMMNFQRVFCPEVRKYASFRVLPFSSSNTCTAFLSICGKFCRVITTDMVRYEDAEGEERTPIRPVLY